MNTENENLNADERLAIITAMIDQAKGNLRNNTFYFLLWGWVVVLANIAVYLLTTIGYAHPYIVWSITIPAWIWTMIHMMKQRHEKRSSTHLDAISMWLWVVFGVLIFTIVGFGIALRYPINPLVLLVSALPTFTSGIILRFRPLIMGGITFWLFGMVDFMVPSDIQPLIGAAAITCGYLIPGYLLKNKPQK